MSAPRPHKDQPTLNLSLHYRQGLAYLTPAQEVLFGGAAGGGKSHLMRVAAILWCLAIPGLQIYLFRRTVKDLEKNHFKGPTSFPALLYALVQSRYCRIVKNEVRFANGSCVFLNHCEHEADADNYRGYEFHVLLIDELTHFTERQYRMLQSRLRMTDEFKAANVPDNLRGQFPRILCSSNPGGVGHHFVKRHWIEHGPMVIHRTAPEDNEGNPVIESIAGMPLLVRPRQFIPSSLMDNPSLDPQEYAAGLASMGDPLLIRAMLDGDWSIVAGAMFGDVWRAHRHICPRFDIPADWPIWRGADDGFGNPHCTLWGTRDPETGTIFIIDEVYGAKLLPDNVIARVKAEDLGIVRADGNGNPYPNGRLLSGILDSAAWADTGVAKRETPTEKISRADQFNAGGLRFTRCKKWTGCASAGWKNIHRLLAPNPRCPDGMPGLRVFPKCANLIRTLPAVMRDLKDPEEIAENQDDHAPDALRYLLQWTDGGFSLVRMA